MLVMRNLSRPAGNPIKVCPACPSCGRSMHLARIAPQAEGLTEIHIYRCGECGVSLSEAADDRSRAPRISA